MKMKELIESFSKNDTINNGGIALKSEYLRDILGIYQDINKSGSEDGVYLADQKIKGKKYDQELANEMQSIARSVDGKIESNLDSLSAEISKNGATARALMFLANAAYWEDFQGSFVGRLYFYQKG